MESAEADRTPPPPPPPPPPAPSFVPADAPHAFQTQPLIPPPPPPAILNNIAGTAPFFTDFTATRVMMPAFHPSAPSVPTGGSDGSSASDRNQSDDDDNDDDDDGDDTDSSDLPRWYEIDEDKSLPCGDELAYITSKPEHSALDHAHWESKTFFELDDPEVVPLGNGRIDWLVEKFNGTKEHPNNDLLMRSPPVRIAGLDWQIKFYPRGNHSDYLSVYVECISMLSPDFAETEEFSDPPFPFLEGAECLQKRRSVAAQIGVIMYNPAEPRVYEVKTEAHQYHKKGADYGWKYFTRLPRGEFHHRQHTQRQAILRNDRLAFTAYIRVVSDPTGCMWQHGASGSDDLVSVTGLRPFTMSLNYTAVAVPLLHFAPFREFVRNLKDGGMLASWLKPLLLKMYTRLRSQGHGARTTPCEGDVMEMLWRISRNVHNTYDADVVTQFRELVGALHAEKETPCSTNRLNTKDHTSIQAAVDAHAKIIACPALLTMELQRQEHDKKTRKWCKLSNQVRVEDRIRVSGISYTLFSFITHCGDLQSSRYITYVRPNGVGSGWYAYQDGHVTRLTEQGARRIHSGPKKPVKATKSLDDRHNSAVAEPHEPAGEVTCVVMYVRQDAAGKAFAAPTTEAWSPPVHAKKMDECEQPEPKAHKTTQADGVPFKPEQHSDSQASQETSRTFAHSLREAAQAASPEPVLLDGEDVVMRDADDDSTFSLDLPIADSRQADLEVGTLDWLGRPYYQGQYRNGKYHGGGHLIALNGDEYLGSFRDGLQHGYGKMVYSSSGNVYEGDWVNGEHHGRGKLTEHATGNVFEGGWRHGRKHGQFVLKGTVTEEDRSCCTICYAKEMTTAFYDCGHVVACHDCAGMVEVCPVCRRRIVARLQLYGVKMTLA